MDRRHRQRGRPRDQRPPAPPVPRRRRQLPAQRRGRPLLSQADRAPVETIVHGDFAPYNCVYDGIAAVGLIDFDTAHPGPRVWDVASAVYRFAPFTTGAVEGSTTPDLDERLARAAEFCRAYALDDRSRGVLAETMIASLVALVTTIEHEAAAGNPKFVSDLQHGHADLYRADVAYLPSSTQQPSPPPSRDHRHGRSAAGALVQDQRHGPRPYPATMRRTPTLPPVMSQGHDGQPGRRHPLRSPRRPRDG
ncbi:phosphotransferase [Curtobacterium flaccumfaciens pv. poinsettiae]|uniref:phosphotransferase n=1 Tax=Curtobacterium poinsettiae TaxID=159612 RepID=UPI0021C9DAFB|nr:phosphotransferase [Curtobacterium flaccumfaciens]MCU0154489.1 phosphotransferase [Curtobacterium flaccumfaciens pv. poinsettiae]